LNAGRLQRLQRSLELALNQEWPQLDRTCRQTAKLTPLPMRDKPETSHTIVATVATDGGESHLSLEPIHWPGPGK